MLRKNFIILIAATLTAIVSHAQVKAIEKLTSPDGQTVVHFGLDEHQALVYNMNFKDKAVVNWSALGLQTTTINLKQQIVVSGIDQNKHRETFDWPLGENARIENNYQEAIIHCQTTDAKFDINIRVYNGSLAFKYVSKDLEQPIKLVKELTQFNLANNAKIYQYHEESVFRLMDIDTLGGISDFPSTLVSKNGLYMSIGEAENRTFTKCVLVKGVAPHSLALQFYTDTLYRNHMVTAIKKDSDVVFKDSLESPWRTISCSESAIGLHDFADLNLKLVMPLTTQVPLNIKPGKVFRVQLSTNAAMDGVDFAVKMNFQYIMLDGGWYGSEWNMSSDPTQSIPSIDMPKIVSYAKDKGVDVILYVGYNQLRTRLETFLPVFKNWGIKGIKFGFVDGGTQKGLSWLDSTIAKVSAYGFVINVHDHYKPTGLARRYPFQLSQEGIRGDENSPDAFHNTVLPYTRFLAGAADFTFCYPNATNSYSKNVKVSKGQQLALTVIYFDPLQAIFWYGRPLEYNPEGADIEFFKYVPTVWDETRYLAGEIGESISVARKKDNVWYIGCATGLMPWKTSLRLDFLTKGKKYMATIYEDDGNQGIRVKTARFKQGDILPVDIRAKAGMAMIFRLEK
ncbi:MAG: glycoside hydrolase family 97 catalytic domain-containing protein [Bacteroidota bacterium]